MDKIEKYRDIIENVITYYASVPYTNSPLETFTVFDRKTDHYMMMLMGREDNKWAHACIIHIAIRNGKCWLMRDNTDAVIADELHFNGVPASDIVIGFQPEYLRHLTGFAIN